MIEKGKTDMESARARVIKRNERRNRGKPERTVVEEYARGVDPEADDIDVEAMEGTSDDTE
jgi:hypothetical protein